MRKKRIIRFVIGLGVVYILIVMGIQLKAVDVVIPPEAFPKSCPEESRNCVMIGKYPYRSNGLTNLTFNADLPTVMAAVNQWIEGEPRTTVIGQWETQTHAVFRTLWWRFPDDFIVKGKFEEGKTTLSVYSKSRLGVSDLGVNVVRVNKFVAHMTALSIFEKDR